MAVGFPLDAEICLKRFAPLAISMEGVNLVEDRGGVEDVGTFICEVYAKHISLGLRAREWLCVFCRSLIKIVGPPLHHLPAFRKVLGVIISGAYLIAFTVS